MNKIYFHICKINNYQKICDDVFQHIISSNIMNDSELYLSIVGSGDLIIPKNLNYIVIFISEDINVGEFPMLNRIKEDCLNSDENYNVLYIHSKGVTTPNNQNIDDWRKYMLYFNIIKYKDCLDILKNYDTCGVDLRDEPVLHYSGNFWWARSEYIKKLPSFEDMPIVLTERHKGEFWVCHNDGKHYSFWDCGINQYERHLYSYKESEYKKIN